MYDSTTRKIISTFRYVDKQECDLNVYSDDWNVIHAHLSLFGQIYIMLK